MIGKKMSKNNNCQFIVNWKNKEGWLKTINGFVCLDFDEYCTKCRKNNSKDFKFNVISVGFDKTEKVNKK